MILPEDRRAESGFATNETAALTTKMAMRVTGQERDLSRTPKFDERPSVMLPQNLPRAKSANHDAQQAQLVTRAVVASTPASYTHHRAYTRL
jgi:hypothetical protein